MLGGKQEYKYWRQSTVVIDAIQEKNDHKTDNLVFQEY